MADSRYNYFVCLDQRFNDYSYFSYYVLYISVSQINELMPGMCLLNAFLTLISNIVMKFQKKNCDNFEKCCTSLGPIGLGKNLDLL